MKSLILSYWTNPDMREVRTYVASYTVRDDHNDLFTIDLNKQLGFYQICEFVPARGRESFIIEQTNRVGVPKIAAFDKNSGTLLGTFKDNQLVDIDENLIFTVERIPNPKSTSSTTDDFIAYSVDHSEVIARFLRLPRKAKGLDVFSRIKQAVINLTKAGPKDVFEIEIEDEHCCDQRMLMAIAVIIHNRGGIKQSH